MRRCWLGVRVRCVFKWSLGREGSDLTTLTRVVSLSGLSVWVTDSRDSKDKSMYEAEYYGAGVFTVAEQIWRASMRDRRESRRVSQKGWSAAHLSVCLSLRQAIDQRKNLIISMYIKDRASMR